MILETQIQIMIKFGVVNKYKNLGLVLKSRFSIET